MKQSPKYNWSALFFLTFLIAAVFFVAMTGWRVESTNDAPGLGVAAAGQAMSPSSDAAPMETGNVAPKGSAITLQGEKHGR